MLRVRDTKGSNTTCAPLRRPRVTRRPGRLAADGAEGVTGLVEQMHIIDPRHAGSARPAQWLTGGVALDANDLAIVEPAAPRIQVRLTSGWPKIPGAVKSDLEATMITDDFNFARYRTGQTAGHYESYFLRANHPTEPRAFWVRYTIFSPSLRPRDAIGELWAVVFDAIAGRHVVAKTEAPIDRCTFSGNRFAVRIGDSELAPGVLVGRRPDDRRDGCAGRGGAPPNSGHACPAGIAI
jgi:hypothetical protein